MSLIDPEYELIDPCPDLHSSFLQFNKQFFGGSLSSCEVVWSKRMTKCAGLCQYHPRSGYCSIRLSEPLLKLRPRKDFVETLLHEMIHAFLFLTSRVMDRDGHGPNFQQHMHRINQIAGTRITIYHSFHAEVRLYQQHWWRCEGRCREMQPFFGWVKRAMNRAPSKNDTWWARHQAMCGGTFVKVKEPEKVEKKTTRKKKADPGESTPKIGSIFKGKGHVLGTADDQKEEVKTPKPRAKKTPKKSPNTPKKKVKTPPFDQRFPGSGQKLGGTGSTPPEKRSRLITDFFFADVPGRSTSNGFPVDGAKTPENAEKKPDLNLIKSPELIQLEHDDFGWDDEDVIFIEEVEGSISPINDKIVRKGNTVYIDEEDLTFDDMVAIGEQKLEVRPLVPGLKEIKKEVLETDMKLDDSGELQIVMEKVTKKEEIMVIKEVKTEKNQVEMIDCPVCTTRIPMAEINQHLDLCI